MIPCLFPVIIISLSLMASLFYAINKMPMHAVYWLSAAVLNGTVLMMGE